MPQSNSPLCPIWTKAIYGKILMRTQKEFLDYLKVLMRYLKLKIVKPCNYKSVGVYVADKSDILLALWDGTFNNKSGGTGDIVQYARERP